MIRTHHWGTLEDSTRHEERASVFYTVVVRSKKHDVTSNGDHTATNHEWASCLDFVGISSCYQNNEEGSHIRRNREQLRSRGGVAEALDDRG